MARSMPTRAVLTLALILCARTVYGQCANPDGGYPGFGGVATTGGAGQTIVRVTNLNNSGAGSLRAAIGSDRCIVFAVAGTITLQSNLDFSGVTNVTIDGFTAPSPGITLKGHPLRIRGASDNVIVRGLRSRGDPDPFNGFVCWENSTRVVFSHLSADGYTDDAIDNIRCISLTIAHSIMGAGTVVDHNFGHLTAAFSGGHVATTIWRSLFIDTAGRNPQCASSTTNGTHDCQFANNLIWNYEHFGHRFQGNPRSSTYRGDVRNSYFHSPNRRSNPERAIDRSNDAGACHASGNYAHEVMNFTGAGVDAQCEDDPPRGFPTLPLLSAHAAACDILAHAGARGPGFGLDAVDIAYLASIKLDAECVEP